MDVYFEEQGIHSLDNGAEFYITMQKPQRLERLSSRSDEMSRAPCRSVCKRETMAAPVRFVPPLPPKRKSRACGLF